MLWFREIAHSERFWPAPRTRGESGVLLSQSKQRDPWGHRVHVALACLYVMLLPVATFPKDAAFIVLCLCAVVRLPAIWRCYSAMTRDRAQVFLWAWTAWIVLGFLWSTDAAEAWQEARAYRVVLTGFALWPVVEHWPWMVWSFLGGVLIQHGAQACEAMELFGPSRWEDGRLGGWLHPIQTGTFCAAAMCFNMAALLRSRTWGMLLLFGGGTLAAGAGLVATGSRGPWLGGAASIVAMMAVTIVRRPRLRRRAIVLCMFGAVAGGVVLLMARERIEQRWDETMRSMERFDEGARRGDAVTRLRSWDAAWEMFLEWPVIGVGTGDFPSEVGGTRAGTTITDAQHAHSTYLHVLACTGAVGFTLMALCLLSIVSNALREPQDSIFSDGALFATVSWLVAAQFDAYQQNGQMFGLLTWLAVICSSMRPAAGR